MIQQWSYSPTRRLLALGGLVLLVGCGTSAPAPGNNDGPEATPAEVDTATRQRQAEAIEAARKQHGPAVTSQRGVTASLLGHHSDGSGNMAWIVTVCSQADADALTLPTINNPDVRIDVIVQNTSGTDGCGCMVAGVLRQPGERWSDGCNTCSCNGSHAICTMRACGIAITHIIRFAPEQAGLSVAARKTLKEIAGGLIKHGKLMVVVEGHADSSELDSQALSARRADAVYQHLVELGVPREMLTPKAYGDRRPAQDPAAVDGASLNRRVSFHVLNQK